MTTIIKIIAYIIVGLLALYILRGLFGTKKVKRKKFTTDEIVSASEKSKNKCEHCSATEDLTIDHIIPISKGGKHEKENYRILCRSCNSRRGNRNYIHSKPLLNFRTKFIVIIIVIGFITLKINGVI